MSRMLRVRQTQTIVPFGVGAVIDVQGESFVAAGTEHWPRGGERTEVRAPRLARRLGVARFYAAPPTLNERFDSERTPGAPYLRFPAWLFCRSCRRMKQWTWEDQKNEQPGEAPKCGNCPASPVLSPMRWIQICRDGHLGDIDWRWWAHWSRENGAAVKCPMRQSPIDFTVTDGKFGLEALQIVCRAPRCGARRNLLNILGPSGMRCSGRNPWQRDAEDCQQRTLVVQRTAGNVYYPTVHSALDIPEAAVGQGDGDPLAAKVRAHSLWIALCTTEDAGAVAALRPIIARDTGAPEPFIDALRAEEHGAGPGQAAAAPAALDFSREEWAAFTAPRPRLSRDFQIKAASLGLDTENGLLWTELDRRIGGVVLAERLREVRALAGFSRYSPESKQVPVNTAIRSTWLPAAEVFGEGVFIRLDKGRLAEWESDPRVRARIGSMGADMDRSFQLARLQTVTGEHLSPRFVLLHTLAHLLIRTLSFETGYSTASLRERVYGRPEHDQYGLLIYTAAGDAEGTLGGLVRQGEPPRLAETLLRTIESAAWCSSDPLCLEHSGQGYERLNRAACHACTLLPETSCETGNTLLDRSMLIGGNGIRGFFEHFAELARDAAAQAVG